MRLSGYVLRAVSVRIAGAMAVLIAVMQILDLLEVTPDIIERGLGAVGMVHYALLRLPQMIDQAAPLGVLAGSIFAFMKLAGDSEIVAMRASGVSVYRLLAMALPAAPALGEPGTEQGQVRKDIKAGNVRSLREIEKRVLPTMQGMQYLGPEYDPAAMAYRLKFIHNGRVVFVDVDARSGMIIRTSR
jgi:hypothetical protein